MRVHALSGYLMFPNHQDLPQTYLEGFYRGFITEA
jgi:hypothetical protein